MKENDAQLTRRERQIMEILHARGQATAADVHQALPDSPSYSAVRALLRILEDKGHVRHRREGLRYVHLPTEPRGPRQPFRLAAGRPDVLWRLRAVGRGRAVGIRRRPAFL